MPILSRFPTGGAGELNFSVVAYASEDARPAAAAENTIAVITETAISSYVFSAEEPEVPDEGMVWISTGTSSTVEFNALKKNGLQVYPISAKQYVGGEWVDVEAKSFQNGVWVDWVEIINFDTASWTFKNPFPSIPYDIGTYDLSNKTLKGSVTGESQYVVMCKNEKMDFSNANTLNYTCNLDKDLGGSGFILTRISPSNSNPAELECVAVNHDSAPGTDRKVSIDVSGVDGSYYLWIGLCVWGNLGVVNFEVSGLHLK